ncbi:hypothetical protein [[Mycobacterium] wendilense]|uniref:Uncharacterized protein n=1 Tax=[Mycobacterium] wendilense TaxID=3064284 RepID=A0ABM9M8F6_9MYCO|nr:hypothetical protein [Mycolicibacterium sp. MU0050]CAJ1578899.1 hypothetical protein MU0050_000236 [Mycolicibacterium sp. MU0050]
MGFKRRVWVYLAVVVLAVGALVLNETVFNRTSEECKPVRELLEFNHAQAQEIDEIEQNSGQDAGVIEYQEWADGLAERAGKVTDPALAVSAIRVADLASRFAIKLPQLRAESGSGPAPGQHTPPIVYEMYLVNAQITEEINKLLEACPN